MPLKKKLEIKIKIAITCNLLLLPQGLQLYSRIYSYFVLFITSYFSFVNNVVCYKHFPKDNIFFFMKKKNPRRRIF